MSIRSSASRRRRAAAASCPGIDLREGLGVEHHYEISLHEREIENRQFSWTFQKMLYDCLHDFVVEMFERNPPRRE